jgi:hypothetical protein
MKSEIGERLEVTNNEINHANGNGLLGKMVVKLILVR